MVLNCLLFITFVELISKFKRLLSFLEGVETSVSLSEASHIIINFIIIILYFYNTID